VRLAAKASVAWLAIFMVMFANGAVRVAILQPQLGEDRARQVSSLTGLVLVLLLSRLFVRFATEATMSQLWQIGLAWLAATVAFEFLFGHFVSRLNWAALLADYNILRGRLWVPVLVGLFSGPALWGALAKRR